MIGSFDLAFPQTRWGSSQTLVSWLGLEEGVLWNPVWLSTTKTWHSLGVLRANWICLHWHNPCFNKQWWLTSLIGHPQKPASNFTLDATHTGGSRFPPLKQWQNAVLTVIFAEVAVPRIYSESQISQMLKKLPYQRSDIAVPLGATDNVFIECVFEVQGAEQIRNS